MKSTAVSISPTNQAYLPNILRIYISYLMCLTKKSALCQTDNTVGMYDNMISKGKDLIKL